MSTLPSSDAKSGLDILAQLRRDAEKEIQNGAAQHSMAGPLSIETLDFLLKIASSPAGSSDALKLLHEFKVHQVELDMQYRQQRENEQELIQMMAYYQSLFDTAPVGYIVVSLEGRLIDGNAAATQLLHRNKAQLAELPFEKILAPADKLRWQSVIRQLAEGAATVSCSMNLECWDAGQCAFLIKVNLSPDKTYYQVTLADGKEQDLY